MGFKPINQAPFKSKASIIAGEILGMIEEGRVRIGDKLPPERIIAEQMGVSRPSVREAISALHISGILETRPGDGTYVSHSPAAKNSSNQALLVLEESESPYQILQARRAVEFGVARLAIEVASDEDISEIENTWFKRYEKGRRGEYEAYTLCGKEFHMAIAKATRNPLIVNMMDRLLGAMQQPLWVDMRKSYYEADPSRIDQMLEIHNEIVEAVAARDTERTVRAIDADFQNVLKQLYNFNE
jgi:GntR family transcriptional repressor for pyruvate dehydrogenase complex